MFRIRVDPDKPFFDLLVTVNLQAEKLDRKSCPKDLLDLKGCRGQEARVKVTLFIENHNPYLKQKFDIDYTPDTDSVVICDTLDESHCYGGKPSLSEVFPTAQLYWRGIQKKRVKAICWCLSEENTDFNLHVDIRSHVFSPNRDLVEVKDMGVNITFIVYGEYEETT